MVKVLTRDEAGDVWHLPGFFAELTVLDSKGNVLSTNSYDMTNKDIRTFIKNGKAEESFFAEYQGCKFKVRTDVRTRKNWIT